MNDKVGHLQSYHMKSKNVTTCTHVILLLGHSLTLPYYFLLHFLLRTKNIIAIWLHHTISNC